MRKIRTIAFGVVSVLALVLAPVAFVAADQSNPQGDAQSSDAQAAALPCQRRSAANGAGQAIFVSTPEPRVYSGLAWQNVECAQTTFRLSFGQRALVVSSFSAESDCNGSAPTNGQWCQTRALLNGAEGAPIAAEPSSFAFDSVAGGAQNWQAHTMNRAWEIRCGNENGCQYRVVVQTKMHDATVTGMWLDEVTNHITVTYGNPAPL